MKKKPSPTAPPVKLTKHKTRRDLESGKLVCSLCLWKWKTKPVSECPGVPRYSWGAQPEHLKTRTELLALKLKPGAAPAACRYRQSKRGTEKAWIWFYDVREAVSLKPSTERKLSTMNDEQTGAETPPADNPAPPLDGALRVYAFPAQLEQKLFIDVPTFTVAVFVIRAIKAFDDYLWANDGAKPCGFLCLGLEEYDAGALADEGGTVEFWSEWTDINGTLIDDYVSGEVSLSLETMDEATDALERMSEDLRIKVGGLCLQALARSERAAAPLTSEAEKDGDASSLAVYARGLLHKADRDALTGLFYGIEKAEGELGAALRRMPENPDDRNQICRECRTVFAPGEALNYGSIARQSLAPGEIVPAGICPDCGYPTDYTSKEPAAAPANAPE
jgi:hypothetical protein